MTPQPQTKTVDRIKSSLTDKWMTTEEIRDHGKIHDIDFNLFKNHLMILVKTGFAERQSPIKTKPQHYRKTQNTRSRPAPAAPSQERIGSIRQNIYQEDAYLIERVNAGMGEWEYVIQYCGEYYATAPTENIARDIVERAQWSRPAPTAFVPMASNELRDLCAKEWQNRAERKQLAYDHRSWVSGWYDGYFCKPDIREHDSTIRNDFLEKAEHLAQTIPDFNRMDYIHLLKESLRSREVQG